MPTDANGVYSLPSGYLAVGGNTIQISQHNPVFEDVAAAMTQRLMASGANPMTGPLKAADGSVSAPSHTFNSDQATGLYKTAAGFGVAVGGTKVAEFGSGGLVKGGKYIGEIFDYVGTAAPALCVFPVGQTLSRAAYPDLWIFAQTEIAAGNTFFNTGDGSTTFGIGDLRGRVTAARDNMGGSPANRLTASYFVASDNGIGTPGGSESQTLSLAQLPTGIASGGNNNISVLSTPPVQNTTSGNSAQGGGALGIATFITQVFSTGVNAISVTSNNTSGGAHANVQPTMITQKAMFAGA